MHSLRMVGEPPHRIFITQELAVWAYNSWWYGCANRFCTCGGSFINVALHRKRMLVKQAKPKIRGGLRQGGSARQFRGNKAL